MRICFWLLVLVFIAPISVADESTSHRVYAKPINRTSPSYPQSELRKKQQGWVQLNYVVTKDGEVVEPFVEASSGSRAFERAAINTVKSWRYEPALLNGEPVQQCKTKVRISFALDRSKYTVSRNFHRKYTKIIRALDQGEADVASLELEEAFQLDGLALSELSFLWTAKARLAGMNGDREEQLVAVRQALAVPGELIPDSSRSGLLTTRVILEIEQNNLAMALDAYSELKEIEGADTSELDPIVDDLRSLVKSDQLLVSTGEIGSDRDCETCSSQWRHRPMRRAIEITDLDGSLGNLELRCEWQRYVDEAREGVAWQIPASWGECSLVVYGETGSTFKLVELPEG